MSETSVGQPSPQFGTAEYVGTPGGDHCHFCHQPIGTTYYRTNNEMTCASCAEKMSRQLSPDGHASFVRAILYGIGAAILGMVLYATFAIVTGIVIGYAALAVGWIVGKAMITGSKGVGGKRYQIVAILLTYAAVSTAAVPIWIHYAGQHKTQTQQSKRKQATSSQSETDSDELQGTAPSDRPNAVVAIGTLLALGLASPFLELSGNFVGGMIGLVILFVGMRFAWRFTAAGAPDISGPFENTPQLSR